MKSIVYLCPECSEVRELSGISAVNEVGRKYCDVCGSNEDKLIVVGGDECLVTRTRPIAADIPHYCETCEPRSPRKSDGEKIFEKMKVLHETAIAKTWSSGISRIKERVERFAGGIKNREKRRVSDES